MKVNGYLPALALVAVLASGCATTATKTMGLLYNSTSFGEGATEQEAHSKVGKACSTSILGLVATGDASIDTARKNGGISKISSVDADVKSVLGFYGSYCTIVRGS